MRTTAPIDLPFVSEAGAHNAVERYALCEDGEIDVTYTFRDGFHAESTAMTPRGYFWVPSRTAVLQERGRGRVDGLLRCVRVRSV